VIAALLLTAAVIIVAGCGGTSGTSSSGGSDSSAQPVFRLGVQSGTIQTLNPFMGSYTSDQVATNMQYPLLIQYSQDLEVQPDLAESWTTSPDGKTWTFKLKSGGVWTDGKPITAQDAAFTINEVLRLSDGVGASLSIYLVGVKSAKAVDPTTLDVKLSSPQAAFLSNLQGLPVLPEHVWAPLTAGNGGKVKTFTGDPSKGPLVVAGPFVVQKWETNGTTIFKRVDTYYGPKSLIDTWGWQVFSNADAGIQALKAGDIDCLAGIPATSVDALEGAPGIQVEGFGQGKLLIGLLYNKGVSAHPELGDPKVREALNAAINRQAIVDSAFRGFGNADGSLFMPQFVPQFMTSPVPVPAFDAAKANQILDDLGFAKGSDGIRVANGAKMSYKLAALTSRKATYGRAADAIRQDLAAIGVDFTVAWVDDPAGALVGPKQNYDNGYQGYFGGIGLMPDPDWSLYVFDTEMLGVYNVFGYSNPAYDKLYTAQATEMDADKRKALIDQAIGILQKDQVEIGVLSQPTIVAWNSRWQNIPDAAYIGGWLGYLNQDQLSRISYQK
jgi:peptide/nickel transport system substrate-binding protein